jgi:hypothetical protein
MKKISIIVKIILLNFFFCNAQEYKRGNNWTVGFYPVLVFDFNTQLAIDTFLISLSSTRISACISDTNGSFLFYCNGYGVVSNEGDLMKNGDTINCPYGHVLYDYYGGGDLRSNIHYTP